MNIVPFLTSVSPPSKLLNLGVAWGLLNLQLVLEMRMVLGIPKLCK